MVSRDIVNASNAQIPKSLPAGLVVVVTGGTSGIGEATLKCFAKLLIRPKIYLVGRSQESANRIIAECRILNPDGEYIFIQKSLELMKNVAEAIDFIKSKEKKVNILFLSAGGPDLTKTITSEDIHRLHATNLYARLLFIIRLLPLLRAGAPELARVVGVASGSHEGPINMDDWQGLNSSTFQVRGQGASLTSIALKYLEKQAPEVAFINEFPGLVMTGALNLMTGVQGMLIRTIAWLLQWWIAVPIEESGERHVFLSTSSAYKAKTGDGNGVPLVEGLTVHPGVDEEVGSGVYSLNWDGEGPGEKSVKLLKKFDEDGTAEKAWAYMTGVLEKALGEPA